VFGWRVEVEVSCYNDSCPCSHQASVLFAVTRDNVQCTKVILVLSKSDQSVMVRYSSCVNSQHDICNHILPGRLSATNGWFFLERTKKYQSFVSYAFSHYQFGIFSSTSLHYRILSCYIYFTLHFVRCTLSRAVGSSLVIGAYKHCIFACFCNFDQQVNQGHERKQGMKREAGESRDWNKVLSFCHSANSLLTGVSIPVTVSERWR